MNVRLHIERLVVDEGVLARGERAGLAHAIELEVRRHLTDPRSPGDTGRHDAAPAHVQAIGAVIAERIRPAAPHGDAGMAPSPPRPPAGGARR